MITSINEYGKRKTYRMEHVNKIKKIIENGHDEIDQEAIIRVITGGEEG